MNDSEKTPETTIENLAGILMASHKIIARLEEAAAESGSSLGVEDWLLLHAAKGAAPTPISEVARTAGVNRQRAHKQVTPLSSTGIVEVTAGEATVRKIKITAKGRNSMTRLDEHILEQFSKGGEIPEKQIHNAKMLLQRIARSLAKKSKPQQDAER